MQRAGADVVATSDYRYEPLAEAAARAQPAMPF
jgi:hypothetical protein